MSAAAPSPVRPWPAPPEFLELRDVRVLAEGLAFPEGPVVLDDGSVAFVQLRGGCVSRVAPDGTLSTLAEVPGEPNGAALGPDGALYLCNRGHGAPAGIQRVDIARGSVEELYTECAGEPFVSPNDLVFDAAGGFWFTDLGGGALYYALPDGSRVERMIDDAITPNGVGISPDGSSLYWAQTQTRQVMRRRLAAPGVLVPSPGYGIAPLIRKGGSDEDGLVVGLPNGQELDSLAIEEGGAVCVGTLLESGITVVDPDGTVLEKHLLPPALADGAVTNICFGGPGMTTAYLTLSLTGRVISCRWPRPGLRLPFQA
ncbi:gluconolactonase [Pseudonocardia thermophila]|jgi:Gluconolactonase|uniref:Gluconolactonase n=1 Tax=Pseudonocardia thermophila TaxID=1848 RepID=A0A1M6XQN8_PSETH|nr:SMP-30/gluconolactonase/LRE family protein [Pseudonocardia thermophila]SHL08233.1 gluconolactonase [Pseudonocardia thermophila]